MIEAAMCAAQGEDEFFYYQNKKSTSPSDTAATDN
jgi:hypothetical protein